MPYKKSMEIVQDTDILAGIHGASLTHRIFPAPGSAMVEILLLGLNHKGVRNVDSKRGHEYFSSYTSNAPSAKKSAGILMMSLLNLRDLKSLWMWPLNHCTMRGCEAMTPANSCLIHRN